jgi:hypothetical protein
VKCIREEIGRDVPARRDAWHRVQIDRILDDQTLEQGRDEIDFRQVGCDVRIEIRRIGSYPAVQDVFAITPLHIRLALETRRKQQDGREEA